MKFEPWVGKYYSDSDNLFSGRKILIVGESHYDGTENIGKCDKGYTQTVVRHYVEDTQRHPFFTNLVTLLTGVDPNKDRTKTRSAWEHFAFYNYVPVFVADRPRSFESAAFWALGQDEFNEVLTSLRPDLVVVLGYRLWDKAYFRHVEDEAKQFDRLKHFPKTKAPDSLIETINIKHPASAGFSARGTRAEIIAACGDIFHFNPAHGS